MSGPRDGVVERDPNSDSARPLQADTRPRPTVVQEALRQRADGLPDNHPSSAAFQTERARDRAPRNRPPEPSPLARPDTQADTDDEPRIASDGSWEWKDYRLTSDESRASDRALERFRDWEGRDGEGCYTERGLTPAMRRIEATLEHGHLVDKTEEFALKSSARFKEKLASLLRDEPDKSVEEHARDVHDAVRYTFIFESDEYVTAHQEATSQLEGQGFQLGVRKNSWGGIEYKGVNTGWCDPATGLRFEVQFHTEVSWRAKQQTHDAYEKIEDPRTAPAEVEKLRAYQREVSARVTAPPGWDTIIDYRKDDW